MDFFKLEIDENYSMGLEYISKHSDTNFSDLRNLLSLKTPGLDFKAIKSEVDENYNMGQNTFLSIVTPFLVKSPSRLTVSLEVQPWSLARQDGS